MTVKQNALLIIALVLGTMLIGGMLPLLSVSALPAEVGKALDNVSAATLYSLQPMVENTAGEESFYQNRILGRIELHREKAREAVEEFKKVTVTKRALFWNVEKTAILCCTFRPGYALRVISDGHTYDLLLCFKCQELDVYRDGRHLAFLDDAEGSPQALDRLLTEAHIPFPVETNL